MTAASTAFVLDNALAAGAHREAALLAQLDDVRAELARSNLRAETAEREGAGSRLQAEEAVALAERLNTALTASQAAGSRLRADNERLRRQVEELSARCSATDAQLAALRQSLSSCAAERDAASQAVRAARASCAEEVRVAVAKARADMGAALEAANVRAAGAEHKASAARLVASTCRSAAEQVRMECSRLKRGNAALLALNARLLARVLRATWRGPHGDGDGGEEDERSQQNYAMARRRLAALPHWRRALAEDTAAGVEAQLAAAIANATAMTSGGDDDDNMSMGTVSALLVQHADEDGDESDAAEWLLQAPPAQSVGVTATTALAEAAAARGDWDGYVASAEAEAASLML